MAKILFYPDEWTCKLCKRDVDFGDFDKHLKRFHKERYIKDLEKQLEKLKKEKKEEIK